MSVEPNEGTLKFYESHAHDFREGTRYHDVSQNLDALLSAIQAPPPLRILDFGCGPGRDLAELRRRGHMPTGLDGCREFVAMALEAGDGEVWHQDFLELALPASHFHGIFANAALFHVPSRSLPRVLAELRSSLVQGGVLFCSNPRGANEEGWSAGRYGCFFDLERWRELFSASGFTELDHYYRPSGLSRAQQPWLAMLWRRP